MQTSRLHSTRNILVSYCSVDWRWAEWIAWQLGEAGHTTILHAWSFEQQESKETLEVQALLQKAEQTLMIVSADYLNYLYTQPEWASILCHYLLQKSQSTHNSPRVALVQVRECRHNFKEPLRALPYLDLVGCDEARSRELLLTFIEGRCHTTLVPPSFPAPERPASKSTGGPHPALPESTLPTWNIPYPRDPFFTGGKKLLHTLHDTLTAATCTQPQALLGPCGIGKTALALEYAYRYRDDYQAVLWVRASSPDLFQADLAALCTTLHLAQQNEPDQSAQYHAVKRWLHEHTGWLLILDAVDDMTTISDVLPLARTGFLLLTTRSPQLQKIAHCHELAPMEAEIAVLFLLRRSQRISRDTPFEDITQSDRQAALALAQQLQYLPLALRQAAAYIEQTSCGLPHYLDMYRQLHITLLKKYETMLTTTLATLVVTWFLAFRKLAQTHPLAIELLQFCACFHTDEIPEMMIAEATNYLDSFLQTSSEAPSVEDCLTKLTQFALISAHASRKTLALPSYIHDFLYEEMDAETQQHYAERAIQVIDRVFPDDEYIPWSQCFPYLLHARSCLLLIDQWNINTIETAHFLNRVGAYLLAHAHYSEAELFYKHALDIWQAAGDPKHTQLVQLLTSLGITYEGQGLYAQAEPLYERALAIDQQKWGAEHLNVAASLNNLASLYYVQGKYTQAEPLYLRATALYESAVESGHPDLAISFNNLAALYYMQGKYAQADQLCQQALAIWEAQAEQEHPHRIPCLNNAARLACAQAKYSQAERLFQRALQLSKSLLGSEHPLVGTVLNNLGELYHIMGKYAQAQTTYQQALHIREHRLGLNHPEVASTLNNLARLHYDQGQYVQAELICKRAYAICEQTVGVEHLTTMFTLRNQALLSCTCGHYTQAIALYQQAMAISHKLVGELHPYVASLLHDMAACYHLQADYTQAETLYQQALLIREQALGSNHPDVALTLHQLARLYYDQAKYGQLQPLFTLERPASSNEMENVILFSPDQEKYAQAELLYQRALSIMTQTLGSHHRDVAQLLEHYAALLRKSERTTEALHLEERGRAIRAKFQQDELLQTQ
jgi:tetratricopeptide (TPR) repeat protein